MMSEATAGSVGTTVGGLPIYYEAHTPYADDAAADRPANSSKSLDRGCRRQRLCLLTGMITHTADPTISTTLGPQFAEQSEHRTAPSSLDNRDAEGFAPTGNPPLRIAEPTTGHLIGWRLPGQRRHHLLPRKPTTTQHPDQPTVAIV